MMASQAMGVGVELGVVVGENEAVWLGDGVCVWLGEGVCVMLELGVPVAEAEGVAEPVGKVHGGNTTPRKYCPGTGEATGTASPMRLA